MSLRRRCACALIVASLVLVALACRSQTDPTANQNSTTETHVSSTPPFQTKEPERYRAIRTVTAVAANGQTLTTKTLIARDGDLRRAESQVASKTIAYLESAEGKFVLLPDEKIYAEVTPDADLPASDSDDALESSPEGLLHAETGNTSYQPLGKEAVGGRNTDKYRVVVNAASAGSVSVSETLIWVDQGLKMPIKSETKSSDGTRVLMELSDISLEVENVLFQIPKDYKKVKLIEFHKRLL